MFLTILRGIINLSEISDFMKKFLIAIIYLSYVSMDIHITRILKHFTRLISPGMLTNFSTKRDDL